MPNEIAHSLDGRHAIVTGASRGIGAAVAHELARRGAALSLVARDEARLRAVAAALPGARAPEPAVIVADLTRETEAVRAMREARARLGDPYALVNNAGAAESAAFVVTGADVWRRMLDVNLMTAVFCTHEALPAMLARGAGRIVNVASTAGLSGFRFVSAYAASKHALIGFTRSLAMETTRGGVTVNAVCPGYTDTDLLAESVARASARTGKPPEEIRAMYAAANPHQRLIRPEEVAQAVAWLCDPGQSSVTGQAIVVDGENTF